MIIHKPFLIANLIFFLSSMAISYSMEQPSSVPAKKMLPSLVTLCVNIIANHLLSMTAFDENSAAIAESIDLLPQALRVLLAHRIGKPSPLCVVPPHFNWSPDGSKILVDVNEDKCLAIVDAIDGTILRRLANKNGKNFFPRGWSPQGSYVWAAVESKEALTKCFTVWNSSSGEKLYALPEDVCTQNSAFTADERFILQKVMNKPLAQFDAVTGNLIRTLGAPTFPHHLPKIDPQSRFIVYVIGKDAVFADPQSGKQLYTFPWNFKGFSNDGTFVFCYYPESGLITCFNLTTGEITQKVHPLSVYLPRDIKLDPSRTYLSVSNYQKEFVFNLKTNSMQTYEHDVLYTDTSLDHTKTITLDYNLKKNITTVLINTIEGAFLHRLAIPGRATNLFYFHNPEYVACRGDDKAGRIPGIDRCVLRALIHLSSGTLHLMQREHPYKPYIALRRKPPKCSSTDGKFWLLAPNHKDHEIWQLPPTPALTTPFAHALSCAILANNRADKLSLNTAALAIAQASPDSSIRKYATQLLRELK